MIKTRAEWVAAFWKFLETTEQVYDESKVELTKRVAKSPIDAMNAFEDAIKWNHSYTIMKECFGELSMIQPDTEIYNQVCGSILWLERWLLQQITMNLHSGDPLQNFNKQVEMQRKAKFLEKLKQFKTSYEGIQETIKKI